MLGYILFSEFTNGVILYTFMFFKKTCNCVVIYPFTIWITLLKLQWKWKWCNYTGCHRRNGPNFGRVFLMLNYTDITQNTYVQSWTVTEIMAIEKCGLLWCPRTVSRPWRHIHPLRMPGNEKPLANIGMQWRRDNAQLLPASVTWKPKANATVVRVFL